MKSVQLALQAHDQLNQLINRAAISKRCLEIILPSLPESMRCCVAAGAYEPQCWSLLVSNAAALVKLKQMLPAMQKNLAEQGFENLKIQLRRWTPV